MLHTTKKALWTALYDDEQADQVLCEQVNSLDLRTICAGREMSEGSTGGDVVVQLVDEVLQAVADGYKVSTWYGDDTEVLIVGYRANQLSFD